MKNAQKDFPLPGGFTYKEDFLTEAEEQAFLEIFRRLEFRTFEFKGYPAKRRVIDYGWSYDFNTNQLSESAEIPEFLHPLRKRAAELTGVDAAELEEALITEYSPGAQINWHRDLPMFEKVAGISLLNSCTFKLKPYQKEAKSISIVLEPRSLYILGGASRWSYLHSIPPVKEPRYSITFRTLRKQGHGRPPLFQ